MFSLLFIDTERVWRGGQNQLLTLIRGLHRRGHEIHLICEPQTLLEARALELGIYVHPMAIRSEVGLISLFRLIPILRKIRPQILAFNTPKAVLIGTFASRFANVGARIIFRRVNFPLRKSILTRLKYTWGIDCIVAISESIRVQLKVSGISASRIRTIYEGIDLSLYPNPVQRKSRRAGEPMVVGTIAHLSSEKGIQYLIEAASLIPEVHRRLRFVIVGDGNCLGELELLVQEKGLKGVFQFAGFHSNTSQYIKTFDIFALPSLSEGLSSSILEAMATSLPIVATEVGGIPELVKHGDNGLLVAPADPASLAQAIHQLADDPELSQRMGLRGRERVEEQFTLERKIIETEELCSHLLKGSASPPCPTYA
jgi:glycosyltransferase involved in cell wall biosynthesis